MPTNKDLERLLELLGIKQECFNLESHKIEYQQLKDKISNALDEKKECASCGDNVDLVWCKGCNCWLCSECNAWTSTHTDTSCTCLVVDGRHHKLGSYIAIDELEQKIKILKQKIKHHVEVRSGETVYAVWRRELLQMIDGVEG